MTKVMERWTLETALAPPEPIAGYCSQCHKVWTLETGQGVCQWCCKPSTRRSTTAKSRLTSARSKQPDYQIPKSRQAKPITPEVKEALTEKAKVRCQNEGIKQDDPLPLSYDQLESEWLDWYQVAERYAVKVPFQDRQDLMHTIILELALARTKTTEPIPIYRAYRIASYMVADYYRQQKKLTSGLDCRHCIVQQRSRCQKDDLYSQCPKLIKLEYLETEHLDSQGNLVTIEDTLADDTAIDLDAWLDAKTWLRGCQTRLIEIAQKRKEGIPLNKTDSRYYERQRAKELKRYQLALF